MDVGYFAKIMQQMYNILRYQEIDRVTKNVV